MWKAIILCCLLFLCGCSPALISDERQDETQNASQVIQSADLRPHNLTETREPQPQPSSGPRAFYGSSAPAGGPIREQAGTDDGKDGLTLNFENAPVTTVAKTILGDILGVGYVIDPRAQGTVSLSSGRPIAKKDILLVLESALHANNLNLVRDSAGYKIVPASDGAVGSTDRADQGGPEPGFGTTVIPLRYVSGETLMKLLEGFAIKPGALRTDPTGNLLFVQGSASERQTAIETVRDFDVDWMRGQSVGLYPIHNSSPEPIVAELEKIMDSGETGLNRNLVKLQSMARDNAVMVVASKPALLHTAAMWISRLDSRSLSGAGVKVYRVRYGDAKQLAQLLNNMFVGAPSLGDVESNTIAPSAGEKPLSTLDRLSAGPLNQVIAPGISVAPPPAVTQAPNPFGALTSIQTASAPGGPGGPGAGSLLPNVRITPDTVNNTILIYADAQNYRTIQNALDQLDRPRLQVAIDVTIAEVTLNDQLNYGVQFFLSKHFGAIINSSSGSQISETLPGFNVLVGSPATPHIIINALHSLTDVKILSNPSLVVVDNEPAMLQVGDRVPVSTGAATVLNANNTLVNTIDYVNTGIILHVTPRVTSNESVLLNIDQEISNTPQTANVNLTPTISQRKVKSNISVPNGQTVLLAGLVSDTQSHQRSGIPILDQLPYVGAAFSSTEKSLERTELIIFIRPQIIHDGVDAAMVAEELRSKMRGATVSATTFPNALNVGVVPPR